MVIEGDCGTSAEEHTVNAEITSWGDGVDACVGKMTWTMNLDSPNGFVNLGTTFIEAYLLLDKPATMYGDGVPAEVLRFLTQKARVLRATTPEDVAVAVTNYTHTDHRLRYHTEGGAPSYEAGRFGGSDFSVVDYALRKHNVVNCYDQAAAVQSLSGAVGPVITWIYMGPYGYINPTKLIGVKGLCNNPFFEISVPPDPPRVDRNDPCRRAFGNHAFCSLSSKIFDACAGPKRGTETKAEYIANAIDHITTLNIGKPYPGTEADANERPGVTSTNTGCSV